MSSEPLKHGRNFEQNTLIWLDKNLNNSDEIDQTKSKFRQIINYIRTFENADECVDYMSSNENEQIYFLISSSLADMIVPLICEIQQIRKIYIFCTHSQYYGKLTQTFNQIGGVFTDVAGLCDTLRRDILTNKTAALSLHNSSTLLLSALSSSTSDRSDQQEAEFMYFQLLAELLVGLKHKQSAKNEFISSCRLQYHGNASELEKIEEFSRRYSKEHAVRWYTRDSFLYRILNNALRTQDIDILFKLGFFIADLHNQLNCLYSEQSKSLLLPSVVYRGQFMTKNDLDNKIKNNIGGFLSINSFFSTSANKQVALMFAGDSSLNNSNIESVLFEIKIDIEKCRRPVADIESMSYLEEEDEILFSMASVFRIESIHRLHSGDIWTVRLVMNGKEDEDLNAVATSIKEELGQLDNLNTFGGLLMKMGDFQRAEQYILMLIKDIQSDDLLSKVNYYSNLSLIYNEQMNYDTAISWAEKALQLLQSDHDTLGIIYNNLGLCHVNKGNSAQALNYFHKTINIYKIIFPSNHPRLAITYLNLGLVYAKQENYPTALEYFFKTNDIYQNCLPINHPNFGIVYIHIGTIHQNQGDYDSALFYLHKCLNVQQRALPAQHPFLIYTYTNLGIVYLNKSNDVAAYNFLQKALEMIDPSSSHPYRSIIMYSLGILHTRKKNLSEALNFHYKALDAEIKSTPPNHKILLKIYKSLGEISIRQKEWIKVIDYYQKAVPISLEYNDSDVVGFYNVIAISYGLTGDYETAARYVELALDVGRRMLSTDHFFIREAEEHQRNLRLVLHRTDKNSEQRRNDDQTT